MSQEARVRNFYQTMKKMAVLAALSAVVILCTAPQAGAQGTEKKVKDQGEFDIYNEVIKDVQANNGAKALQDLATWQQKYPDSAFKDDWQYFYIQAYNLTNQPLKVLDTAAILLTKDLKTAFPNPQQVLQILYIAAVNASKTAADQNLNPTAAQLATGEKAAQQLLDFLPEFFAPAKKPAGTDDAAWAKGRTDVENLAKGALMNLSVQPGNAVLKANPKDPKNCAAAEAAYKKALEKYPDSAQIAYLMAGAMRCQQAATPEKVPQAIYMYARAAALDPAKGGMDPKTRSQIDDYVTKIYTAYHGSDEGLQQLKELSLKAPLPPADFKIETASEVARKKEEEFKSQYPQLALWMGIKRQLTDTNGEQYFESTLKQADVSGKDGAKALKGVVMEGKPACRSKELLVAIPEPNQPGTLRAEISLKLDAPLTGKPVSGTEIQFNGVPAAFSKEPFLLTMETEKAKIEGLKAEPCAAAPVRKGPGAKKGVGKKKR